MTITDNEKFETYNEVYGTYHVDTEKFDELLEKYNPNFFKYYEQSNMDHWEYYQLICYVSGRGFQAPDLWELDFDAKEWLDTSVYDCNSFTQLAEEFVGEGLFGEIPEHLERYIAYEVIGCDLRHDHTELMIDDSFVIFRCD